MCVRVDAAREVNEFMTDHIQSVTKTHPDWILEPLQLPLGGGLENFGSETKGRAGKKLREVANTKGKFFMTKFKVKNIDVMGISRYSRDAKFKIFSKLGGTMPKP